MMSNRSANAILYYIENKGWFSKYRTQDAYFTIPYEEWRNKTLINIQHIQILNEFIFEDEGAICLVEENGQKYVKIWSSEKQPFKSLKPRQHIYNICKKKQCAKTLSNYLDEFYYYDFRDYRIDDSLMRYRIEYDHWYDLFQLSDQHVYELNTYLRKGSIKMIYEDNLPAFVVINI